MRERSTERERDLERDREEREREREREREGERERERERGREREMAKYNNFIKKTPKLNTVENNSRVVTQRSENPLPYIIARSHLSSLLRKRERERERERNKILECINIGNTHQP